LSSTAIAHFVLAKQYEGIYIWLLDEEGENIIFLLDQKEMIIFNKFLFVTTPKQPQLGDLKLSHSQPRYLTGKKKIRHLVSNFETISAKFKSDYFSRRAAKRDHNSNIKM
jgi:hypothetical protein